MTTLSQRLLNIYNENITLTSMIEDTDFLKLCKDFLMDYVRNCSSKYFHPYDFENHTGLAKGAVIEILLALSSDNSFLEKNYVLDCTDCDSPIIEKEIEDIFFCRNIDCNMKTPQKGDTLFNYIKKNVYYKFSISDDVRSMVINDIKKLPPSPFQERKNYSDEKSIVGNLFLEEYDGGTATLIEREIVEEYSFNVEAAL